MKNWKKPIAAVLAGICCVVGMPQVQLVLPALQAAAAETADTGTVGTLTYTLESGFRWRQLLSFLRLAGKAGYPRNTAKNWIGCVL